MSENVLCHVCFLMEVQNSYMMLIASACLFFISEDSVICAQMLAQLLIVYFLIEFVAQYTFALA